MAIRPVLRCTLLGIVAIASAADGGRFLSAQSAGGVSPSVFGDLAWRCIGPFDGGPVASVEGVPGEPGIYLITTTSGGEWKTIDGGGTWAAVQTAGLKAGGSSWVDPANPRRIAKTDAHGITVSLDGGSTWVASHNLPIAEIAHLTPHVRPVESAGQRRIAGAPATVSIADSARAGLVFAGTKDGVSVSFDNGASWQSLRLNMPPVAINDLDIRGDDLVAGTQGRSTWALANITPLRQVSVSSAGAPAILFKPADAVVRSAGSSDPADPGSKDPGLLLYIDYYLRASSGPVTLDVLDAAGRVVHTTTSAAPDAADRWLPVDRPLAATAGHHRVEWDLRFDPPPSPHHRFAQLARNIYENVPADPEGPRVLPGNYRVRLTAAGQSYTQPLVVRADPSLSPAALDIERQQFALAMKAYDAMQASHRAFLQLTRLRAGLKPLLASADPDIAALATDLDTRLGVIDGSDWTGLVIPDADDASEVEEDAKEGKHPDFVPPKPVSLSKDYDDPTSVLGRNFANVDHAPAFAILGTKLGEMLTRIERAAAPDALATGDYDTFCQQLADVLGTWQGMNGGDVPGLNVELAKRRLSPLPVAASIPSISCAGPR
jgi:hypothetical protein